MARQESMAQIDAALLRQQMPQDSSTGVDDSPATPRPAPDMPGEKPKLTADEKRAVDAKRQAQTDLERQAEKQAQQYQQFQQQQAAQQTALENAANATVQAAGNIIRGAQVRLESVPTPGSIIFPLIILLVFFFLLIPVNGHTRFVWLWLTLTGNADIMNGSAGASGDIGGGSSGDFSFTTPNSNNTQNAPTLVLPLTFSPSTMTGVEDL